MNRRCLILAALLALVSPVLGGAEKQKFPLDAAEMKAVLHTATPQEGGFIDRVLARVEKGTLPLDLVQSTFLWARKKPKNKFFYFKEGLIRRAADRGIKVS
jgi:hypothetical protein